MYNYKNCVGIDYSIFVKELETNVIKNFKEAHLVRHFSLLEIEVLANRHDLELIHSEEFLSGKELSENTWGACVVLRKKKI